MVYFDFGEGYTECLDGDKIILNKIIKCKAYIHDNEYNAYIMLQNLGRSYVGLLDDNGDSLVEFNIQAIKMSGYDQTLVERFHPNYNCDEIAWLDDCYCALDNQLDNDAHWSYLAHNIVREDWEEELCLAIYRLSWDEEVTDEMAESLLNENHFETYGKFGKYLAEKYRADILNEINKYEGDIMEETIDNLEEILKIDEYNM